MFDNNRSISRLAAVLAAISFLSASGAPIAAAESATTDSPASVPGHRSRDLPLAAGEVRATALFQVDRRQPELLKNLGRATAETDREWEVFCRTQLALLRSYFVIQSALRAPGIAQLPLLADQSDQVQWVIDHLECGFDGDSEILSIALRGPADRADDLQQIVNAVSDAYLKEAVFDTKQRRLIVRDALQQSFAALQEEIRNKMDMQMSLANDLGVAYPTGGPGVRQQIDMRRLGRVDDELLRIEGEQLAAKLRAEGREDQLDAAERSRLKFLEERIAQLRESQQELEKRIQALDRGTAELAVGSGELATLQSIASDMSLQLEYLDIEDIAPNRIRRIQKATITRGGVN